MRHESVRSDGSEATRFRSLGLQCWGKTIDTCPMWTVLPRWWQTGWIGRRLVEVTTTEVKFRPSQSYLRC
jgi:hypothetical protein